MAGNGCSEATCNSTFVEPVERFLKSENLQTCPSCDTGFGGLNCNICQGITSCAQRQKQSGRGISGVEVPSSNDGIAAQGVNHTLTCYKQPQPITAAYFQCDIHQDTFSSLFPGNFVLTGINVVSTPNFTSTGMSSWNAQSNSSYFSVFLDGVQQFTCQGIDCMSGNSTNSVAGTARFGTNTWSCGNLKCSCDPQSKVCSSPLFPLANIINGLNGAVQFPCDYVDPLDPNAKTQCSLSVPQLNQFVGDSGLPLTSCTFGQCLSQYELEQNWMINEALVASRKGSSLSHGVIAGLAVLGALVLLLICSLAYSIWQYKLAARRPRDVQSHAVGLWWENVGYEVIPKKPRWASRAGSNKRNGNANETEVGLDMDSLTEVKEKSHTGTKPLRILHGVTSWVKPGSLNLVLGPSGSGKTTLVDILANRLMRGSKKGQISFISTSETRIKSSPRQVAFVDQEDAASLPGYLTVKETLNFAARLSTQENVPKEERYALVQDVIETLGLSAIADHKIGDARKRGISGGELRRVSLGVALVGQPKILIADECTSGLDAISALRVMQALRNLASGDHGTTVIMTIHQPASQLFQMADNVVLLGSGRVLYSGSPASAIDFCGAAGNAVPVGHNVADHLLAIAFQDMARGVSFNQDAPRITLQLDSENKSREKVGAQEIEKVQWMHTEYSMDQRSDHSVTTFMTQMLVLVHRAILMTQREVLGAAAHIVGSIVLSVFVGACFYQVKLDLGGFQNRVGAMFFIFILLLFMGLSAITNISHVRLMTMRERANGFYSSWSWASAHLLYDLILLRAVPSIIIVTIVYWMTGLRAKADYFFEFLLITIIFSWIIAIYNMILATIIEELSTTILLGGLYVLFNIGE